MLKTCSLFTQNLGCVLQTSVSYTRDGTVIMSQKKISQTNFEISVIANLYCVHLPRAVYGDCFPGKTIVYLMQIHAGRVHVRSMHHHKKTLRKERERERERERIAS